MHAFGRRMLKYPPVQNHPIAAEISDFLFKENYFDSPLPKQTHEFIEELWRKYNGEECAQGTVCDYYLFRFSLLFFSFVFLFRFSRTNKD